MMLFGVAQWFSRSPDSSVTGGPTCSSGCQQTRNQNEFKSASGLLLAAAVFGG
jgi:hypothetical protein